MKRIRVHFPEHKNQITGKGNFTGTVTKKFAIAKATPTVTAAPTASLLYGQKLSDSTLTGGSAVNPNGNAAVAGKWSWVGGNTYIFRRTDGG